MEEAYIVQPSIKHGHNVLSTDILPCFGQTEKEEFLFMTKSINKNIPFNVLFKDEVFILTGIASNYAYADGKRTDNLVGYKYTVVDTVDFEKIVVKVARTEPLMTSEGLAELRENGEKVLVEFVNGVDKLYIRRDGSSVSVEDSFSAEDILLVEQN